MLRKLVSLPYINLAGNTSGSVYTNLQLALITFSTMYHFWSRYTLKVLSPSDKQFAFNFSFETRKELCVTRFAKVISTKILNEENEVDY